MQALCFGYRARRLVFCASWDEVLTATGPAAVMGLLLGTLERPGCFVLRSAQPLFWDCTWNFNQLKILFTSFQTLEFLRKITEIGMYFFVT